MAKLRLNNSHRERLVRLVRETVTPPQLLVRKRDAAYEAAADAVRSFLTAKFPPADMKVLEQYQSAEKDHCIHFQRGEGSDVRRFVFRKDDSVPLIPLSAHTYRIKPYRATPDIAKRLDDLERAEQAVTTALEKARAPYITLIRYQAKTYEDVLEVWPEAEQIRDDLSAPPPPVPISAVKDEIAADMKRRQAEQQRAA